MLEFASPWALFMLLAPAVVRVLTPEFRDRGKSVRAPFFARLILLTGKTPTEGTVLLTKGSLRRIAIFAIWVCLVVALARPEQVGEPIIRETAARDMLLIVDLSGSMEAQDFTAADGTSVTRLDAVKAVLDEFITRRESDRLALAVFGNAAFPQAPFTDDHATVRTLLGELQVRMAGAQTMIGDAIGLAVRLFEASDREHKTVIILTDGNDTGSLMPVTRAARIAAENGITIHTIAIGDPTTVGEKALDVDALKEISEIADGRFFLALDRDELETIYAELDRLEPELIETQSYRPRYALFHYPLALGMALLIVLTLVMLGNAVIQGRPQDV